jgi:hypothetical protein
MSERLILVGIWRGNNIRSICLALEQLGHVTTTVRVFKGRLHIKGDNIKEVITIGDRIWLPQRNEEIEP